ncbi:TIGR01621 family pseudouridine synthase [Shewanella submarina]|uniref:TIGR01621 family pseudouridine synthase n=1 Tax=Shewanella submarina TaxID=2016376 RepID=A0ABV7GDN7_9GAMM|nr:TIGR01621 family pseudouridine synthase [Shewanella submarina]MCL1039551.1 TIGR01621 family pseudouridine synthase [Shewanella submarina]
MYQIIQDEADFLVISKSANVHFHSQDGEAGVVARVELDLNIKLYPVHRLDTLTSGLIILAKSSEAAARFTELFSAHQVQKYYLALAKGKPKKKQGWVIGDMAKSRRSQYKLLRSTENPAITQFFSQSVDQGLRLYLLKPLSGKTHQLRVALASLGCPILGDTLYGGEASDRGYLHAWQLEFNYQGQDYQFCAEPLQGAAFDLDGVKAQMAAWSPASQQPWPKAKSGK